jgi:hypothetical protein
MASQKNKNNISIIMPFIFYLKRLACYTDKLWKHKFIISLIIGWNVSWNSA